MAKNQTARELLGRKPIAESPEQGSSYGKRAIPYDLSDPLDVARLEAICNQFENPWTVAKYKRPDLAADIGDLFVQIDAGEVILMPLADLTKKQRTDRGL